MKSLRAELYQLLAHYIPEATLQQNVQDRDFPTRRVRRSHFRLTWMSLKRKCSELRRLATAQELSNPVSFALENSWTTTVNLTSNTFLSTLHSVWRRFLPFLLSPWRLFSPLPFSFDFWPPFFAVVGLAFCPLSALRFHFPLVSGLCVGARV